ncbi:hypothetical protein M9H77_02228 [Catharanthus roseus]|uniref:Uncharacterized protein n=1 Tax=Catharanthus roseus TaxID=4058 RepID=A0ACC0C7U5_CATRO|nr:hypothetical protein M9H77_02228 [Catharanthus roseus]
MDKDLPAIISHVKVVRIVLERDHLSSILGISDNGNTLTVDSNRRSIDEDPDWNFNVACICFNIQQQVVYHRRIIHRGDLPSLLLRALAYFFGHTLVQKGGGFSEFCRKTMIINRAATSDSIHNIQQVRLPMGQEEKEVDSPLQRRQVAGLLCWWFFTNKENLLIWNRSVVRTTS